MNNTTHIIYGYDYEELKRINRLSLIIAKDCMKYIRTMKNPEQVMCSNKKAKYILISDSKILYDALEELKNPYIINKMAYKKARYAFRFDIEHSKEETMNINTYNNASDELSSLIQISKECVELAYECMQALDFNSNVENFEEEIADVLVCIGDMLKYMEENKHD